MAAQISVSPKAGVPLRLWDPKLQICHLLVRPLSQCYRSAHLSRLSGEVVSWPGSKTRAE